MRWFRNQGEIPYLFSMPFVEVNMEQLLQEMSAYSDLLIILGVLVLAKITFRCSVTYSLTFPILISKPVRNESGPVYL